MLLPQDFDAIISQNVDVVTNEWGSFCRRILAWHVEMWARITIKGFLEACPQHKGEESRLFLHIYGNAGEKSEEVIFGSYAESANIPIEMQEAMVHLRCAFTEACSDVLQNRREERDRKHMIDLMIASLAKTYLANDDGVTMGEMPIASSLWRKASFSELSREEFLVEHLCLIDDDGHIPETIGSSQHLGSSLTLVHGSGCFLVKTRILANGTIKFAIVKVDELKVNGLLKGDD